MTRNKIHRTKWDFVQFSAIHHPLQSADVLNTFAQWYAEMVAAKLFETLETNSEMS